MKDEPVDILDEQGNQTGQVLMKKQAHDRGLWHPVVHLWIYNSKGQVLLQKRSLNKLVHPGVWDISVGGHAVAGDTPTQAVIKEAREELDLELKAKDLTFIALTKYDEKMPAGWWNRFFAWTYLTKLDRKASDFKIEKDEISEVKWFEIDEMMKLVKDVAKTRGFAPDILDSFRRVADEINRRLKNG